MRLAPIASAFVFGLIFGGGLVLSGMIDPGRVKAFLDVAGVWNPSLALVMGGAIAVAAPAYFVARRRSRAFLGGAILLPENRIIDKKLIAGAAIFGLGWGLSGICPGPALVLAGYGARGALVFVAAMVAGAQLSKLAGRNLAEAAAARDG